MYYIAKGQECNLHDYIKLRLIMLYYIRTSVVAYTNYGPPATSGAQRTRERRMLLRLSSTIRSDTGMHAYSFTLSVDVSVCDSVILSVCQSAHAVFDTYISATMRGRNL